MISLKELSFIMITEMFPDRIDLSPDRWSEMFDRASKPNDMGVAFVFPQAPWATDGVRAARQVLTRLS